MLAFVKPKYYLYALVAFVIGYFLFCYVMPQWMVAGMHIGRFHRP